MIDVFGLHPSLAWQRSFPAAESPRPTGEDGSKAPGTIMEDFNASRLAPFADVVE
jgi:hypothetical protein